MKKCKIDCFDPSSIEKAIEVVEKIKAAVSGPNLKTFIDELATLGVDYARVHYQGAQYEGINDVTVNLTDEFYRNTNCSVTITASGSAVLFIEFGTGVYYGDDAAARGSVASGELQTTAKRLYGRGEYGKGRGKQTTWVYIDPTGEKIFTHGNPSNACLYQTRKYLEERLLSTAKEVFKW